MFIILADAYPHARRRLSSFSYFYDYSVVNIEGLSYRIATSDRYRDVIEKVFNFGHNIEITNPFPPTTLNGIHTMSTGVNASIHRVFDTEVFDEKNPGELIYYSRQLFTLQNDTYPIYALNNMNGGQSACFSWSGCEFDYNGHKVDNFNDEIENLPIQKKIEKVFNIALDSYEKRYNLIMVNFNEFAKSASTTGVNSKQSRKVLDEIFKMILRTRELINNSHRSKRIRFILTSDNALVDVELEHILDIERFLPRFNYEIIKHSPLIQLRTRGASAAKKMTKILAKIVKHFNLISFKQANTTSLLVSKHTAAFSDVILGIENSTMNTMGARNG